MTNGDIKDLCLSLARSDSEEDIIYILKNANYWEEPACWQYYGDNENNFATIGNQQSTADTALVEKIVNSVDAVLMRECYRKDIKPDSTDAPKSTPDALKKLFGIHEGKLSNLNASSRTELAQNISLVATGQKSRPSYSIIDLGEGQTSKNMPLTLLSLNKSNKLKIPFVQGKFNMGATGSLQFCGTRNIQLIISKRDPKIADEQDETANDWSFTIIRRENPSAGIRNSSFKYLAPNKKVLSFSADSLPLLPGAYPNPYEKPLSWGTFIKLYEYELTGYKTIVKFDLYNRLSLLMPNIALPIRLYERRKGYTANTYEETLSGLSVRLDEDKRDNLEPNYPSSHLLRVMGQEMEVLVYAFKRDQRLKYSKNEGLIFSINGQSQGFISKSFFEKKSVGMGYLADSILVLADCTKFDGRAREDLFMNSRDRFRDLPLRSEIEHQLEDLIKNHPGLRELKEQRRREEIQNGIQENKPLKEVLEKIIKSNPTLSKLLISGLAITNPFKLVDSASQTDFKGKKFPSFFKLSKEYPSQNPKNEPINRRCRIQFETDAANDYFKRDNDEGTFEIEFIDIPIEDYVLNLWNGIATLTVQIPDCVQVGDVISFKTRVSDISRPEPFQSSFFVKVEEAAKDVPGSNGERKKPSSKEKGQDRETTSGLGLPNIIRVHRADWERYKFDEGTALQVKDSGDQGYDFYINADNIYLKNEMKAAYKIEPELLELKFVNAMVLIGLSLINYFEKQSQTNDKTSDDESVYAKIQVFTRAISPVVLPIINSLELMETT